MEAIEWIKKSLLKAHCPLIEANEDLEQIKILLTENSQHKTDLIAWILQELTDSSVASDAVGEIQKSFGLDFDGEDCLKSWQMALTLIEAKVRYSEDGFDGLRLTRHYMEFLQNGGFAQPISSSKLAVKSSLIPRDIEKDVLHRSAASDANHDLDLANMDGEAIEAIKAGLLKEIETKQKQLELLQSSVAKPDPLNAQTVNLHADAIQSLTAKHNTDFEQDFKSWTDRIQAPKTNESLENLIKGLHDQVRCISRNLNDIIALKKSALQLNELVKQI